MEDIASLESIAREIRARTIETSSSRGIPHLASCLSCIDILTVLYFSVLRIDPNTPRSPSRDRFILSKGHGAPALFQVLAKKGFYSESMLDDYGMNGSVFGEHPPSPDYLPGIEAATGSLGHGLSIGLGMAMASRIQKLQYNVYTLLSDGECNEGSVWEAAMLSASQKVDNLFVIIDFNKWQATGRSREIMALDPLADKWRSFGWNAIEIDGHDIRALLSAFLSFQNGNRKPSAFIAHTVKGKGVSFMEDDNNWHYRVPTAEEVVRAKQELGVVV